VLDTRQSGDGIRRRRQCLVCSFRFTTHERVEQRPLLIVKKDSSREPFNRDKVLGGLQLACRKRPVSADQIEVAADRVEQALLAGTQPEVHAAEIGRLVLRELQLLDRVAWLRFASVYQEVGSPDEFLTLLQPWLAEAAPGPQRG
jgi:transcriptional repressor NrdR